MRSWHHSPVHIFPESGAYIVTSGTYQKQPLLATPDHLTLVHDRLLDLAEEHGWLLQAWSVLPNHYHFVGHSADAASSLPRFIRQLHWETAVAINGLDGTPGRKVWFNYWDRQITFQRSYLARLNYVHYNPQKHGVCEAAADYPWCSAPWLESKGTPSFVRTVQSIPTDKLSDPDPY